MANTGADFFTLFGGNKSSTHRISLEDVQKKWGEIDTDHEM